MRRTLAIFLVLVPSLAAAQPPVGEEFQVNTYTTDDQRRAAVGSDGAGGFVVSWVSLGSSGTDTSGDSIQAQRYAPDGSPAGAQFQVNTWTPGTQYSPAVGPDGGGGFVVAWMSYGSGNSDTDSWSIQAQRYAADGSPAGGEFQANTYTTSGQYNPAIGPDGAGGFVVAWESYGSGGTDSSGYSVQAQRYAADGSPAGGEFQVNAFTPFDQYHPKVSSDGADGFVVAWTSFGSSGTDTSFGSAQARRYASDGSPAGPEFQINTYTSGPQVFPAVAPDGAGGFVATWMSAGSNGGDTSGFSIQAQRYAADGSPVGGEFQVNTYTTSQQYIPAVGANGVGGFVVTWMSLGSSGSDSSGWSLQGQRYAADGSPNGSEFQVNSNTFGDQLVPEVGPFGEHGFVVTWTTTLGIGTDIDGDAIQAQLYSSLIFADGFESGDTTAWSATVP